VFVNSVEFVFFFSANDVQWRLGEVWSVFGCFRIFGEKSGVEYVVDLPIVRELEAVRDRSQNFGNWKWSFSFGRDLLIVSEFQVSGV